MISTTGRRDKGFTLLELILVMVIISAVLSMAAPSLRGFFASRKTHDAAANILSLMGLARTQAITEGKIYRLNLDLDEAAYWISVKEEGTYVRLMTDFGRKFLLPDDMSMALTEDDDEDSNRASEDELKEKSKDEEADYAIDFYPQGASDSCTIRLSDLKGDVIEIMSPSPAERYRIVIPEKDA